MVVYLPADDQFTILHYNYSQVITTVKKMMNMDFQVRSFKYGWEFPDGTTLGLKRMPKWKKVYAEIIGEL